MANLPTRTTADVAADHVTDHNTLHGFHNLIDTAGDLIVGTGADTAGKLAKGSALQYLRVNAGGTALEYGDPTVFVGVKVKRTANLSLTSGSSTVITWDAEDWDSDGFHDNTTNPSRLTVPSGKAGKYRAFYHAAWDASGTGVRQGFLRKNGSTATAYGTVMAVSSAGGGTGAMCAVEFQLIVGDYIEAVAYQDSGGTLNFRSGTETSFSMQRIGD